MKRVVLSVVAALVVLTACAQRARRFSFSTDVGAGVPLSEPASTPLLWQVTGYWNVGERFAVGVGTGLSFYEKTLVPVYGDAKLLVARPQRFTPFLQCGAGYAFAAEGNARGGLLFAPAVGVECALRGTLRLFVTAGYGQQRMERLKTCAGPRFAAAFRERLNHRSLTFRVGVRF